MAAAKDDPVSVEDNDNIEAMLDSADRLSSTISRPFSGLSTVLARIRAASIAQKKELDATLEVCQQMQKKVDVAEAANQDMVKALTAQVEAFTADMPNIVKKAFTEAKRKAGGSWHVEEPTEVVCTSAPETATEPMKKKMKYTTTVPMASGKEEMNASNAFTSEQKENVEMNAIERLVWNSNAFTPEQKKEIWSRVQEKTTPVAKSACRFLDLK